MDPFDAWYEDTHSCSIKNGYCHVHGSPAYGTHICRYAASDPLLNDSDTYFTDTLRVPEDIRE